MVKRESGYLYEEIVQKISNSLEEGTITQGSKLPSLRNMSIRYGCSISVIMQAYGVLEALGKIYAVEKSGYFACETLSVPLPSPEKEHFSLEIGEAEPVSIIGRIVEASNNQNIIPLGAGILDSSFMPLNQLKREIALTLKESPEILSAYTDELGAIELRRAIRDLMETRSVSLNSEDILLTNGCSEALALAVQSSSDPGDLIVLESPVFLGIIQILKVLKRRIITIPTSVETGMDLHRLESVLKKEEVKAVVMTALYQNPLGFCMPEENRRRAVELAETYDITLIEDDIYHDCAYSARGERPLKSFDRQGHVIYCSSFSKTIAPGFRSGWLIGGRNHRRCRNQKMAQSLGNSALYQRVLAKYIGSASYPKHLKGLQKTMARQMLGMTSLLTRFLPEGTAITQPRGGYYLWVQLPEKVDTLILFEDLLERGISIVPGQAFSSEERYSNCMRISFTSPITSDTENAVRLLASRLLENYK